MDGGDARAVREGGEARACQPSSQLTATAVQLTSSSFLPFCCFELECEMRFRAMYPKLERVNQNISQYNLNIIEEKT